MKTLQTNMDALKKLEILIEKCYQVDFCTNPHKTCGKTAREWLQRRSEYENIPENFKNWKTICILEIYEYFGLENPVIIYGETLNQCMNQVSEEFIQTVGTFYDVP